MFNKKIFEFLIICAFLSGCAQNNDAVITNSISDLSGNIALAAPASVNIELPEVSTQSISHNTILSEYTTDFSTATKNRANNISLGSDAINGKILLPGEVFSFNDTVGPTVKERGFKLARIFIRGRDAKGYGGGICQVSSTLYNAALDAGMSIIERHPHSKRVQYVPEGFDAATSYGGKNFKFENNKPFPVVINSKINENKLIVSIEQAN